MTFSFILTAISLAAFLWLAGVLEWRGSDGNISVGANFICNSRMPAGLVINLTISLGSKDASVFYDISSLDNRQFDKWRCTQIIITSSKRVTSVTDFLGNYIQERAPVARTVYSDNKNVFGSEFVIASQDRFSLNYSTDLMEYSGLSERSMTIATTLYPKPGDSDKVLTNHVTIIPPRGFQLVDTVPTFGITEDGRGWDSRSESKTGSFYSHITMRNPKLYRLDHIIDSSIAAVMGVAVGGILNAYLALILLRRRPHS